MGYLFVKFEFDETIGDGFYQFILFFSDIFSSIFFELIESFAVADNSFELILESCVLTKKRIIKNTFHTSISDDLLYQSLLGLFIEFFHDCRDQLDHVVGLRFDVWSFSVLEFRGL